MGDGISQKGRHSVSKQKKEYWCRVSQWVLICLLVFTINVQECFIFGLESYEKAMLRALVLQLFSEPRLEK